MDLHGDKSMSFNDTEVIKYNSDKYLIRDNYKDKQYYLKQLELINIRINRFEEKFSNGEVKAGPIAYYGRVSNLLFNKIGILYVLNVEINTIKQNIEKYFEMMFQLSKIDKLSYNDIVDLLSLGYLYNIEVDKLEFVKSNMIPENYVDAILDLLRNKIFNKKVFTTKDFYFKDNLGDRFVKDTDGLMKVINSNNEQDKNKEFINYLDKVKSKHFNRLLKEYERIGEDRYTYTGSYDFKFTAIAKILGIDKELLKDSKFIAVDLL